MICWRRAALWASDTFGKGRPLINRTTGLFYSSAELDASQAPTEYNPLLVGARCDRTIALLSASGRLAAASGLQLGAAHIAVEEDTQLIA